MAPAVSVIVPVRNTRAFVGEALASLRAQTIRGWEAVVVDDGSTDGSDAIAAGLAAEDRRIRLLRQESRGVSEARNAGLDVARGEHVLFLDSDDLLEPDALEVLLDAARASDSGAAFGAYHVCGPDASPLYTYVDVRDTVGFDDLIDRAYLWTAAHLVERRQFETIRFDRSLHGYEDQDVWLRLAAQGVRWACVDHPVARYRIRPGSASKDPEAMVRDAQRVYVVTWSLARTVAAARGAMLTRERLRACMDRLALGYASRAAVAGDADGPRRAVTIWRDHGGFAPLDPMRVARAGQFAVIYGLGLLPVVTSSSPPAWARRLQAFWTFLADDGLVPPGLASSSAFALRMPLDVSVRAAPAVSTVSVVSMGAA